MLRHWLVSTRFVWAAIALPLVLSGCATLSQQDGGPDQAGAQDTRSSVINLWSRSAGQQKKPQHLPQQPLKAVKGSTVPRTASTEAVIRAISQLGTPYDWGGETAGKGFDCSGLTYYIYQKANIDIPRTARTQYRATKHVHRSKLRPGDLVFFRIKGRHVDHVGVYVGDHRFIHAPRTGEHVKFSNLNNPYWRRHFVAGGRVPGASNFQLAENR